MSLNQDLQTRLEAHFKPVGIIAYSNCCRFGCTGAYDEDDDDFRARTRGINFIRLHLNGMNYNPEASSCYVMYEDFDYLLANWDEEKGYLEQWCSICGLQPDEFEITQPENVKQAIRISFTNLTLEEEQDDGDEGDGEGEEGGDGKEENGAGRKRGGIDGGDDGDHEYGH